MTDQTIFNEEETAPVVEQTTEPTTEAQPASVDYSETLGGIIDASGKQKYSNVNDALKSINFANEHISTIEAENAQLKVEMAKAQANEDLVAQIQQASKAPTSVDNGVSMEAIAAVVQSQLAANDKQTVIKNNQSTVANSLTERFGDKAEELYLAKGKELGLGPQTLNEIAGNSPEAVLAWFGALSTTPNPQTVKSTIVTNGAPTQQVVEKKSVMGMTSDKELIGEWNRIKREVEAEASAA